METKRIMKKKFSDTLEINQFHLQLPIHFIAMKLETIYCREWVRRHHNLRKYLSLKLYCNYLEFNLTHCFDAF